MRLIRSKMVNLEKFIELLKEEDDIYVDTIGDDLHLDGYLSLDKWKHIIKECI